MTKKLIAPVVLMVALNSTAVASDHAIRFVIDRDGSVSIDCMGTVPTVFSLVKKRTRRSQTIGSESAA